MDYFCVDEGMVHDITLCVDQGEGLVHGNTMFLDEGLGLL